MKLNISLFYLIACLCLCISCNKRIEIDPPIDKISDEQAFANEKTATATVVGLYSRLMTNAKSFAAGGLTLYTSMASDDIYTSSTSATGLRETEFATNAISPANVDLRGNIWAALYNHIYHANSILDGINKANNISGTVKNQLIGETQFIRAFCYFYLVNLFGDVPLITTTNYAINATMPRSPAAKVYDQIIADLEDAVSLLKVTYPSSGKYRANKWTAVALLARTYLYTNNWVKAEEQSSAIINSGNYSLVTNLANVFLSASTEAIWQLRSVAAPVNTFPGFYLVGLSGRAPTYPVTSFLMSSFETGDQRKTMWIGTTIVGSTTYYWARKYKVRMADVITEDDIVFRLSEQYLIRAEARAKQDKITEAKADLMIIRNRVGLGTVPIPATTQSELMAVIEHERQVELFTEWGHRWLDLKRYNRANAVLGPIKAVTWQPTDVLWPIPVNEILYNPALTQNPGY